MMPVLSLDDHTLTFKSILATFFSPTTLLFCLRAVLSETLIHVT